MIRIASILQVQWSRPLVRWIWEIDVEQTLVRRTDPGSRPPRRFPVQHQLDPLEQVNCVSNRKRPICSGLDLVQRQLEGRVNDAFDIRPRYRFMSVTEQRPERIEGSGKFMGSVVAVIRERIRKGARNNGSHLALAAGRDQPRWRV